MRYVLVQSVLFFGLLVAVLAGPGHRLLPESRWITTCGITLCLAALVLVAGAFWSLGSAFRVAPAPRQHVALVQRGIYRHLRHPMYTAAVSLVSGLFLLRSSWEIALLALAIIVFYLVKARHEEVLLLRRYPEYQAYRRSARGVIPLR